MSPWYTLTLDPNQLPPTTFSQEAEQNKFNQSLFVRIAQQKGSFMHLLRYVFLQAHC